SWLTSARAGRAGRRPASASVRASRVRRTRRVIGPGYEDSPTLLLSAIATGRYPGTWLCPAPGIGRYPGMWVTEDARLSGFEGAQPAFRLAGRNHGQLFRIGIRLGRHPQRDRREQRPYLVPDQLALRHQRLGGLVDGLLVDVHQAPGVGEGS